MPSTEHDTHALRPRPAGLVAGGIAGVAAALLSLPLRSPDEIVANSLSVAVTSLFIGIAAGELWRRTRNTPNARRRYWMATGVGFVTAMAAVAIADRFLLSNLIGYALPLAVLIFLTVALLTPLMAGVRISQGLTVIPVVLALAAGIGLFGRGNVASGDLALDDLTTTTAVSEPGTTGAASTTTTGAPPSGTLTVPDDLAASYTASQGVATYTVPENVRGLTTVAVGRSETLTGVVVPGGTFEFTVDLATFVSDQDLRDGRVARLFSDDPIAIFTGASFPLPSTVEVDQVVALDVAGTMTIAGVSRELTWSMEVQVRSDGIAVTGEADIVLSDFGVTPPSAPGIVVEDSAHLEVLFLGVPG